MQLSSAVGTGVHGCSQQWGEGLLMEAGKQNLQQSLCCRGGHLPAGSLACCAARRLALCQVTGVCCLLLPPGSLDTPGAGRVTFPSGVDGGSPAADSL